MSSRSDVERARQARLSVKGLRATAMAVERTLAASQPGARRVRALLERLGGFEATLADTYRWGREAMAAAYRGGDQGHFQEWRRALRYHACQLRLLAEICPQQIDGRLDVLRRLGDLLEEDRELALCLEGLGEGPAAAERRALIRERQEALRALARPVGKRLYSDRPATFVRRLRGWLHDALPAPTTRRAPLAEAWRRFSPGPLLRVGT